MPMFGLISPRHFSYRLLLLCCGYLFFEGCSYRANPSNMPAKPSQSRIQQNWALFGKNQLLWPQLLTDSSKTDNEPSSDTIRLGIFPTWLQHYSESKTCDSCHRLSKNGQEFFFDTYFRESVASLLPNCHVETIYPHDALLKKSKIELETFLPDTFFYFEKILDGFNFPLIYRENDGLIPDDTRRKLSFLCGKLNLDYLFVPKRVSTWVYPVQSNQHQGALIYEFAALLWNNRQGKIEWVSNYREEIDNLDLDVSLASRLDKNWKSHIKEMGPLWHKFINQEPR